MAVKRAKLFNKDSFHGFLPAENKDFEKEILRNFEYIRRGDAEIDEHYKQPIGYGVLMDIRENKVFAYKRAEKDEDYKEKRLQGNWSWGVGGHVDESERHKKNPVTASLLREIEEEVLVEGSIDRLRIMGYINDDSDPVGRVHFGILYLVEISGGVSPKASEMSEGEMRKVEELREISKKEKVEKWSEIALERLKHTI